MMRVDQARPRRHISFELPTELGFSTYTMLASYFSAVVTLALVVASGPFGAGSKPDSKIARNVLEGKAEGYCSVRRLGRQADKSLPDQSNLHIAHTSK